MRLAPFAVAALIALCGQTASAQSAPAAPDSFKEVVRPPTPGELRAQEIEVERRQALVRECKERRSRGEKVGIAIGTIGGVLAGLLIQDGGGTTSKVIAGSIGGFTGGTVGAIVGESIDPRSPCDFKPPSGEVPALPPIDPPRPASTIGAGPEPDPVRNRP